ncbi:MAG: acyltransferase family protein, partial [Steroidobacteraceae bacterium]
SSTWRSRRSLRRCRGSNGFFWLGSNYFSEQADLMPLLHTWSLSVEEQYYLVWPTLLIALMLVARKRWGVFTRLLLTALLLVGITTFAAGVRMTDSDPPGAFFLMPMRAWEFALGGALVLAAPTIARWPTFVRTLLFVIGIALIGVATVTLDSSVAYPGTAVLWPTLGTVALIAAGCGSGFAPVQAGCRRAAWWPSGSSHTLARRSRPRSTVIHCRVPGEATRQVRHARA